MLKRKAVAQAVTFALASVAFGSVAMAQETMSGNI